MGTGGRVCFNCFTELEEGQEQCRVCGYDFRLDKGKYPMALPLGSVLNGCYISGRVLGQGGFGITYIAQEWKTKEIVALKEYMPDTLASRIDGSRITAYSGKRGENFEYGKQCFLDEAKTLAEFIGNPNIVRVHSYFEENGTAYFVMDYVRGKSFQEYIEQKGGKITWQEAEDILIPIMDALAEVHKKGIIHRDVTPDNIFITEDGTVKLLDFGAARYSWGNQSQSLDIILKHGYAPKEQYSRRGHQGPYTDVYSVAACFYFSITGRIPPDSIERQEEDDLLPPSSLGIVIPAYIEDAVLKGLNIRGADRFQDMDSFKNELLHEKKRKTEEKPIDRRKSEYHKQKQVWKKRLLFMTPVLAAAVCIALPVKKLFLQSQEPDKPKTVMQADEKTYPVIADTALKPGEQDVDMSDTGEEGKDIVRGNTFGNLSNGGIAVEDDEYIYLAMLNGKGSRGGIKKVAKRDGDTEQLTVGEDVDALNYYDGFLYYLCENNEICRIKTDGSGREEIMKDDRIKNFYIENDRMYYCLENDERAYDLYCTDLNSSGGEKLVSNMIRDQYIIEDGWIYFWNGDDFDLHEIRVDGTEENVIYEELGYAPEAAGEWIYFYDTEGIYRMNRKDQETETLCFGPGTKTSNVWKDTVFFITDRYDGETDLCRQKAGEEEIEKIVSVAEKDGTLYQINVLEHHIVFYNLGKSSYSVGVFDLLTDTLNYYE